MDRASARRVSPHRRTRRRPEGRPTGCRARSWVGLQPDGLRPIEGQGVGLKADPQSVARGRGSGFSPTQIAAARVVGVKAGLLGERLKCEGRSPKRPPLFPVRVARSRIRHGLAEPWLKSSRATRARSIVADGRRSVRERESLARVTRRTHRARSRRSVRPPEGGDAPGQPAPRWNA